MSAGAGVGDGSDGSEASDGSPLRWRRADLVRLAEPPALARGGYGAAAHVRHPKLGAVAPRDLSDSARAHATSRSDRDWQQLLSTLVCLHHPHVIQVLGCIMEEDYFAVVTELAHYGSVKDVIDTVSPEKLPITVILRIIHQAADGMSYLHSHSNNLLHLDLCADNVLITNGLITKLAGFGIVDWTSYLHRKPAALSTTTTKPEALARIPPEILRNESSVSGKKCDVYGFAMLIWEVLASRDPQEGYHSHQSVFEQIVQNKRPCLDLLREDSAKDVVLLMEECWHPDFEFRPEFSAIVGRTADMAKNHESNVEGDESWLKAAVSRRQVAWSREIGAAAADSAAAAAEAPAALHLRALRHAEDELIHGLRHCCHVASILDSWGMLDLQQHQRNVQGCKSEREEAAVLLQEMQLRDVIYFLAFMSALSITGQDELKDRIFVPALEKVTGTEQERSELIWWMLVLKIHNASALAGTLNSDGFLSGDDKSVTEAQPTGLQQAHALMVSVLGHKKEGLEHLRNELGKLQSQTLNELLLPEQFNLLRKVPFVSMNPRESAQSSRELTAIGMRSQGKVTKVEQLYSKGTCNAPGDLVFSKIFDDQGGALHSDNKSITLIVPAGAIKTRQELYVRVVSDDSSRQGNFSKIIECGPLGLCFEKPVQLMVPHCAPDTAQLIAEVSPLGSEAILPSAVDRKADSNQATVLLKQSSIVTILCHPFLHCERHWWLFSRRRLPLFVFGFLYPNTGVARIYYAHISENLNEILNNEFTSGGRYVQSQRMTFVLHPERGSLIFEELSIKGNSMMHPVTTVLQESHGCVTLPMMTSAGIVKVCQELGNSQFLVFGDGSSTPAVERAPSSPAGQIISTFDMKALAISELDCTTSQELSSGLGEAPTEIQTAMCTNSEARTSIYRQKYSRTVTGCGLDELSFDPASSSFDASLWCRDVAVSAEGTPLLAAGWDGLKEYDGNGHEISSWTATTELGSKEWIVAVDAARDGRVAVGLWYSRSVALLRRCGNGGSSSDAVAVASEWTEECRVADLQVEPWRVSVCGDYLAVAEGVPRNVLVLVHLPRGVELRRRKLDHAIQCVTVTAEAVITASLGKLKVGSEEAYVVDGYSHNGDRLWQWASAEKAWDVCASPSGRLLYLALNDSDRVTAICAGDGSRLSDVITSSHGLEKPWRLSMSTGEKPVLAVISYQVKKR